MEDLKVRYCSKCGKVKFLTEFCNHKNKLGGKSNVCKDCHRKYCRKYYKKNKSDYRERAVKNLVSARIVAKKSYKKNRKEILYRAKIKSGLYPWLNHYKSAKQRCLNSKNKCYNSYGGRGIKFLISLYEVKKIWFRDKAYLLKNPSIDRKNNNGNYVFKNCRFIEMSQNLSGSKNNG